VSARYHSLELDVDQDLRLWLNVPVTPDAKAGGECTVELRYRSERTVMFGMFAADNCEILLGASVPDSRLYCWFGSTCVELLPQDAKLVADFLHLEMPELPPVSRTP
jgi:hypothetical protein